jgi:hypothetical protein
MPYKNQSYKKYIVIPFLRHFGDHSFLFPRQFGERVHHLSTPSPQTFHGKITMLFAYVAWHDYMGPRPLEYIR